MATPVLMPKAGISVETCILTKWHKKVGEPVKKGDLLFSYETDKSALDEEAQEEGILLATFFDEGSDVPVMVNVCVIGNEGEDAQQFKPQIEGENESPQPQQEQPQAKEPAAIKLEIPDLSSGQKVGVSPRARMTAEKLGVSTEGITGTGPNGRIIERDVRAGAQAAPAIVQAAPAAAATTVHETEYIDQPFSNMRKVIAKSMMNSLSSMAQLTHTISFDATDIMELRKKIKDNGEKIGLNNITLNDIILFAVSRTLLSYKDLNAHLLDNTIRYFTNVNLGMAVDTERGLMVPTLFAANKMSLNQIAQEAKELAKSCQNGAVSPDKLQGGTFTVSNLGSFGIEHFTPIINPPQTGILGVGTIIQRVREVEGEIKLYPAMELSLTYDHRAVDGAPASRFLRDLKYNLENFSLLLLK